MGKSYYYRPKTRYYHPRFKCIKSGELNYGDWKKDELLQWVPSMRTYQGLQSKNLCRKPWKYPDFFQNIVN